MSQNQTMSRAVMLSLSLALVMTGCKPADEQVKFERRPKMYQTQVSLSPSTSEIASSMTYSVALIGKTTADNWPVTLGDAKSKIINVVNVKPDYEKIKSLSPSLVVYDAELYNDQDVAQIKNLGIDVFEFKAKTLDGFEDEILKYGALLAAESEASTYVDKIVAEASEQLPSKVKVAFILPGVGGQHLIAGTGSFQADVLKSIGAEPAGPAADKFVPVNAEALIQMNPDIIITGGSPDKLMSDPRLKTLSAIAKAHVRGIDADILSRKGYRVDSLIKLTKKSISSIEEGAK